MRQLCEVMLIIIDVPECTIIPVIILTCKELHTAWRRQRLGVHIHVLDALRSQCVYVRSLVLRSAVASEALHANVVGKEEDNVGFLFCLR